MLRGFWAGLGFLSALAVVLPPDITAQARPATSAAPPSSVPTLELVGEYRCTTCPQAESFGLGPTVVAGTGSSFAVLTEGEPNVRVWDLASGRVTEIAANTRYANRVIPAGAVVIRDSIVVAGRGLNHPTQTFTADGRLIAAGRLLPLASPPPGGGSWGMEQLETSPSAAWELVRQSSIGYGQAFLRADRATGGSEIVDFPASVFGGSPWMNVAGVSFPGSAAISDDGAIALGSAETAYRLVLIPGDGSPRIEGGRSIPKPTSSALEQLRLNAIVFNNSTRRGLPSAVDGKPEANRPVPTRLPEGTPDLPVALPHFAALQFDAKGRLWVHTNRGSFEAQKSVFDVFSPTLQYLGEVIVDGFVRGDVSLGAELLAAPVFGVDGKTTVKVWRVREP